jgi:DNA gyrase subunit A
VTGITTKEEDLVSQIAVATTLHKVLFFTSQGRVFQLPAYQLTEMQRQSKGIHLVNLLQLEDKERVITFIPLRDFGEGKHLFFVTARGIVKKSDLLEFVSITRRGIRAINLDEGDELSAVFVTSGEDNVLIATAKGYGISFMESEVRPMGRSSRGVKGIALRKQDRVVGASTLDHSRDLLIVSARGMGKRVKMQNFPIHHRGGKGIILMKFSERTSEVIGVQLVTGHEEILISSQSGTLIRINCSEVSVQGRSTRGVTLVRLHDGDLISSFALVE